MTERIAVFGGAFDPFHLGHLQIAERLLVKYDRVLIVPCGTRPEPDKRSIDGILPVHRAAMMDLSLRRLAASSGDRLMVEYFDLEQDTFTRTRELQRRFEHLGQLWHVVGADWIVGGASGGSKIPQILEYVPPPAH